LDVQHLYLYFLKLLQIFLSLKNVAKIKGTHNAMLSGCLAAETIFEEFENSGEDVQSFSKILLN